MPANPEMIAVATESVKRMQEFDVNTLPRTEDFGRRMNFADAVEPARKLVSLHQRINLSSLAMMPQPTVEQIRSVADSSYNCFQQILTFTAEQGTSHRDALVQSVIDTYDMVFNTLLQPICFGVSEMDDLNALKNDIQKALQGVESAVTEKTNEMGEKIEKDVTQTIEKIKKAEQDANTVLQNAREAASATGVSQHAKVFQEEANNCRTTALGWLGIAVICLLVFVGVGYLLFRDFSPDTNIWFLVVTRGVVFSAIVYAVFFCVKNYMVNQHNYVVNKHRQNALQTYQALVGAGASPEVQDIVLTHAARCIFEQRDTGYAKGSGNNEGGNVVNFSPVKTAREVMKSADGD